METKKSYCDYSGYLVCPCNHSLNEADFYIWAWKASCLIDSFTHGRASAHAEALSTELSYACGQIAEVLHQNYCENVLLS